MRPAKPCYQTALHNSLCITHTTGFAYAQRTQSGRHIWSSLLFPFFLDKNYTQRVLYMLYVWLCSYDHKMFVSESVPYTLTSLISAISSLVFWWTKAHVHRFTSTHACQVDACRSVIRGRIRICGLKPEGYCRMAKRHLERIIWELIKKDGTRLIIFSKKLR